MEIREEASGWKKITLEVIREDEHQWIKLMNGKKLFEKLDGQSQERKWWEGKGMKEIKL